MFSLVFTDEIIYLPISSEISLIWNYFSYFSSSTFFSTFTFSSAFFFSAFLSTTGFSGKPLAFQAYYIIALSTFPSTKGTLAFTFDKYSKRLERASASTMVSSTIFLIYSSVSFTPIPQSFTKSSILTPPFFYFFVRYSRT